MKLYDFLSPSHDEVKKMLGNVLPEDLSQKTMLDLASGEGTHLAFFFDKKIKEISVVDQNTEGLNKLFERYRGYGSNITLINADVLSFKYNNIFDLVYLGDNSIQIFNTYSDQYKIIDIIAKSLKTDGVAVINITLIVEENILKFNNEYKLISDEGDEPLQGKIKVDIFNQELVYYFINGTETRTIRTRILLRKELEEMVDSVGLVISKVSMYKCKNGNITYFYVLKLKNK